MKKGRKRGSKSVFCTPDATLRENESLARYGKGSIHYAADSAAAGWVQQIGIALEAGSAPALQFVREHFAAKLLDRFAAGDVEFFENFAAAMRTPVGGAASPQHAALLAHVRVTLEAQPDHRFSRSDLRAAVTWPKGYGAPDDRTLGRMTKLLGVPMQRGAPTKTHPAK